MKSTSHYILGWRHESRDDVIIHLIYYFALELYILIVRISRIVKKLYLQRQPTFEYHRQYFSIRYLWTLLHMIIGHYSWLGSTDRFKIFNFFGPGPTFFAGPGPGTLKIFRSRSGTDRLVQDRPVLVLRSVKNGKKVRKLKPRRQNISAGISGTAFYSHPQPVELIRPVRRIHFEIKCT